MHPLPPRSESLLRTLIETYLLEGGPVGSRLLSKRYEAEPLSSATIRNVLSDLEDEAFLVQPHTSAGRVPTERAYRYYVDRWVRPLSPDPELGARLASTLNDRDLDPEVWVRHASRVLAEVMQGVCVALPRRLSGSRLMKLEFVPLEPGRIVAIWVGSGGDVEHQLVENAWGFSPEALTEMGNFATAQFRGLTLSDMRQRLLLSLQGQAQEGRLLRERLADLTQRLQASEASAPPVVVAGLGALGAQPEFEDLQAFRGLVRAFEEQERLARLLNAFAEASATRIQLLLGSENPYLDAWPLATAVRTVPLGPSESVTFAVVGPMRMDYGRVLGGLQWWSEALVRRSGEEPNGV